MKDYKNSPILSEKKYNKEIHPIERISSYYSFEFAKMSGD
jgi:hypothetical protein